MNPDAGLGALRRQQQALAALITAQAEPPAAAHRAWLRPLAGRAPRLGIYRHAVRVRLVAALQANYPVLHQVLGDEAFEALGLAYLAAHPSTTPSIRWFGQGLAPWLDARLLAAPDALPHPALADLARMEWAIGQAFDSADAQPVTFEAVAATPVGDWPGLRFAPLPGVQCLPLQWAVEPLWRQLSDDPQAATAPPEALPHALLVWRAGPGPRWRSLPADEASALAACLAGAPFAAVCGQVQAGGHADAAGQVAAWLAGWVRAGLLQAA